nr:integrase, catalytic region, zinc finger, CCHC-type, peptidase aspartic, catalytic [Tanacetum cinerariifolium]
MIVPSKDTLYNGRKGIGFENPSYFGKAKDLRPSLYDEKVIGIGYTPMFLIHSDEALEIEKFKRARENKIEFAYDYGNSNASYVNEKINFSDDYFQEIINPDFEKIDSPFQQTSSLKPYVPTVILEKIIIDLEDEIVQIYLWIIDSGCSKHMTGNRALLTNFVEKFLGTVLFGNNDFAMIGGYGDVVIGSMTIKKVYYVKGLGHNLFSVGQFCDKGLEVAFRKSTCFVQNEDGVDLLTSDRSSNFYTIALNEVASNTLTCLLAKASSSQSLLWHQRLSHLNFATINNLVNKILFKAEAIATACFIQNRSIIHKRFDKTLYELMNKRKPNIKFFRVFGCRCYFLNDYEDVGKLKAKGNIRVFVGYSKESDAFRIYNRRTCKIHESIMKSSTTNVENSINEEVFHEVSESFQGESSLSSLNDDVQQSTEEDVGKLKAKWDIRVFVEYSKEAAAFKIYNKRTRKIHESVNVNFDKISKMASKQFSLEPVSNLNETGKSLNPSVSQVSETSKKDLGELFQNFYDEYFDSSKIMKSSTTNVETSNVEIPSNEEEVFHESSESFQTESSSSSLNDDVQQSSEEVEVPSTNTLSISNNMIPNVDEASTSHNVFNERLEDA